MGLPQSLGEWLVYLETLHPKSIALGLERVRVVQERLAVPLGCPVITVGGTNGKGSTCAMIEAVLRAAGYRTALYTSPHLLRYNERLRFDGVAVPDDELVAAFANVENARCRAEPVVPLTYFEFGTLAAFDLIAHAGVDVAILEVGLGGRLDAVNAVDPDVSVVTAIDIDHVDYLGPDRESIGREKAGIFRPGRPAVCGDPAPPNCIAEIAREIGAEFALAGRDFGYEREGKQWRYWSRGGERYGLPIPALRGDYQLANAATALAALEAVSSRLPVSSGAIRQGLVEVELPGRFQVWPGRPVTILDVAHNPHAARALAATLVAMGPQARTHAVVGMLRDKDIAGVLAAMRPHIARWHVAPLPGPRGAAAEVLQAELALLHVSADIIVSYPSVAGALRAALEQATDADRIVVFGSFLTVAVALDVLRERVPS